MRKFFALALAVAMVLSLASVSFAATNVFAGTDFTTVYDYSGDRNNMEDKGNLVEYGDTAYIYLKEGTNGITDFDMVEKLKIKAEFEMGEDLVESISIVKKYIDDTNDGKVALDVAGPDYYYFIAMKIAKGRTTGDVDVVGTLELNRKNVKSTVANDEVKDEEYDFAFTVWHENNYLKYLTNGEIDGTTGYEFKWDDLYVLKFNCDDEVDLEFGKQGGTNEGVFTVDVSGQGKMVIDFNTKANEAIAAANEGVEMFFVNFNGAKFNRTGSFEYEMEDMVAAYQIVDDKLVEIPGLELDSEVATFNTRTLGNYVFATAELVNPAAAVEAPVVEAPAVTNPSTGF